MLKTLLPRLFPPPSRPPFPAGQAAPESRLGDARVAAELRARFARYRTDRLHGITAADFRRTIDSWLGTIDAGAEGYCPGEVERQRDLSIKFHWGHNHDFGDFQVEGRMPRIVPRSICKSQNGDLRWLQASPPYCRQYGPKYAPPA